MHVNIQLGSISNSSPLKFRRKKLNGKGEKLTHTTRVILCLAFDISIHI